MCFCIHPFPSYQWRCSFAQGTDVQERELHNVKHMLCEASFKICRCVSSRNSMFEKENEGSVPCEQKFVTGLSCKLVKFSFFLHFGETHCIIRPSTLRFPSDVVLFLEISRPKLCCIHLYYILHMPCTLSMQSAARQGALCGPQTHL